MMFGLLVCLQMLLLSGASDGQTFGSLLSINSSALRVSPYTVLLAGNVDSDGRQDVLYASAQGVAATWGMDGSPFFGASRMLYSGDVRLVLLGDFDALSSAGKGAFSRLACAFFFTFFFMAGTGVAFRFPSAATALEI